MQTLVGGSRMLSLTALVPRYASAEPLLRSRFLKKPAVSEPLPPLPRQPAPQPPNQPQKPVHHHHPPSKPSKSATGNTRNGLAAAVIDDIPLNKNAGPPPTNTTIPTPTPLPNQPSKPVLNHRPKANTPNSNNGLATAIAESTPMKNNPKKPVHHHPPKQKKIESANAIGSKGADAKPTQQQPIQQQHEQQQRQEVQQRLPPTAPAQANADGSRIKTPAPIVRTVEILDDTPIHVFAKNLAVTNVELVKAMIRLGEKPRTVKDIISKELQELLTPEFGHVPKVLTTQAEQFDVRPLRMSDYEGRAGMLVSRHPVVAIMGHVDHGKTTLLDALRETSIAATEAGGITQKISAFQVQLENNLITFLDTPGHAVFTQMRARGALVTDIAVVVVAADDGVMAQTEEVILQAQAAKVPIIIAINKIDTFVGSNPSSLNKIFDQLSRYGIIVEDRHGDVPCVKVSAIKKIGLTQLVETICFHAELLELKAVSETAMKAGSQGQGIVIESKMSKGFGPVATILGRHGVIRVGENVVVGDHCGKIVKIVSNNNAVLKEVRPSEPCEIYGLDGLPAPGDDVIVVESEQRAKEVSRWRLQKKIDQRRDYLLREKEKKDKAVETVVADLGAEANQKQISEKLAEVMAKEVPAVVKADMAGSVEALVNALSMFPSDEVALKVIHQGTGNFIPSDVDMAVAAKGILVAFNVNIPNSLNSVIKQNNIPVYSSKIIYDLVNQVRLALSVHLKPAMVEDTAGVAKVKQVFQISVKSQKSGRKQENVAGCTVESGTIFRSKAYQMLVVRSKTVVFTGAIKSLKHLKDDVDSIAQGSDCGIVLADFDDFQVGDEIKCVQTRTEEREIQLDRSLISPSSSGTSSSESGSSESSSK